MKLIIGITSLLFVASQGQRLSANLGGEADVTLGRNHLRTGGNVTADTSSGVNTNGWLDVSRTNDPSSGSSTTQQDARRGIQLGRSADTSRNNQQGARPISGFLNDRITDAENAVTSGLRSVGNLATSATDAAVNAINRGSPFRNRNSGLPLDINSGRQFSLDGSVVSSPQNQGNPLTSGLGAIRNMATAAANTLNPFSRNNGFPLGLNTQNNPLSSGLGALPNLATVASDATANALNGASPSTGNNGFQLGMNSADNPSASGLGAIRNMATAASDAASNTLNRVSPSRGNNGFSLGLNSANNPLASGLGAIRNLATAASDAATNTLNRVSASTTNSGFPLGFNSNGVDGQTDLNLGANANNGATLALGASPVNNGLNSNRENALTSGLRRTMGNLASGASDAAANALNSGANALNSGASALNNGANTLTNGADSVSRLGRQLSGSANSALSSPAVSTSDVPSTNQGVGLTANANGQVSASVPQVPSVGLRTNGNINGNGQVQSSLPSVAAAAGGNAGYRLEFVPLGRVLGLPMGR